MGNEACTTTNAAAAANCAKVGKEDLPFALPYRRTWEEHRAAQYVTAQGEDNRGKMLTLEHPAHGLPPSRTSQGASWRNSLNQALGRSQASFDPEVGAYSDRTALVGRLPLGRLPEQPSSRLTPRQPGASREEAAPRAPQQDWETVEGSPHQTTWRTDRQGAMSTASSSARPKWVSDVHGSATMQSAIRTSIEAAESVAANQTEPAKPCYFDQELGEAGPVTAHHDDSGAPGGRERRWHRFRSGATYDGEWVGGVRDGMGKQCWPDGTVYVGEWKRGRSGGSGEIRHHNGDTYTGEWVNGRAHGSGVFRHQGSHAIYEGEFVMDMREGFGVELWVDGSWYAGEFRKGGKHGSGEHRWPDGTYYVGSWRANELAGPGRYYVKEGPSYQGQWTNSVIDGAGVFSWADGTQYEGQYQLDKKHGFGILTTPDGESKEAFWTDGREILQPGSQVHAKK